jgi:outer membrane lipoprotein-sorting protein
MPDRRKTASLALLAFFAAVSVGQASAASAPSSGAALLRAAIGADDRVSYAGTITTLVYGPHGAGATVVRVDHAAPTKWRMWFVAPADAYGRLIVSNESLTYQYEPKTATVYSDDWSQTSPGLTLDIDVGKVLRNYVVDQGPTADVAGRDATELSLVSKYSGSLVERLWLDDETKLVLRRETYLADGTIEEKTSFDNVRFVNDLPKSLFDLSVPSGMQVKQGASYGTTEGSVQAAQSQVHFTIASPQFLPEGFSLEKASLASPSGVQTVQLLYTDGLRDFSVFENSTNQLPNFDDATRIDVGDTSGFSTELAGETLVTWNDGGLNITMVGDFTPKELARIGASIAP